MAKGSTVLVEDPSTDLEILEGMAPVLEEYIVKDEVYRTLIVPTSKGDQNIRMTGGDMLARLHRLQGERDELTPAQQQRLDTVKSQIEATIRSYRTRFNERLLREMKARMDSLRWFLDDCGADRRRCRVEYPFEMRNRQRIQEILKQVGPDIPADLNKALSRIDQRIREFAAPDDFIWTPQVQKIYPKDTYWYLYMLPPVPR